MNTITHITIIDSNNKVVPSTKILVGSRRRKLTTGDIDVLIVVKNKRALNSIRFVRCYDKVVAVGGKGVSPRRLIFKKSKRGPPIKVDVFFALKSEMPYALLHHSSGKKFNIRVRAHARRRGWKLNQYGLFYINSGRKVRGSGKIKTERDLLKFLGVTYKSPEDREE